ncbi:metallophosphoesterase [Litchfieldia alkalitelluris]|uniref:metallophosphoesterase n=1 Tax=Litchfieldia alkalitelluris TaxID=304268 RepID=UPI000996B1C2|nr:metallophosphoesterase [Litchfieldia alkalitelluris]
MYTSLLLLIIFMISYIIYIANTNTKRVSINKLQFKSDSHITSHTVPLNILHLSDLHIENLSISPNELYKYLKDEEIDLIAITGDFLDRKKSIPKLIPYLDVLNKLSAPYGMYAVFGNHDYVLKGKNFEALKQTLENHGCVTLQNENKWIPIGDKMLNIIGIDDYSTKRSDVEKSYKDLGNGFNLVLTHDPNIVLHMKNVSYDLLLSGHFHGGQIHWPKPYHLAKMGKLARLNIIKGLHYEDGKPYYISEGLGQTGVNIRVGSSPEITFHQIHLEEQASIISKVI